MFGKVCIMLVSFRQLKLPLSLLSSCKIFDPVILSLRCSYQPAKSLALAVQIYESISITANCSGVSKLARWFWRVWLLLIGWYSCEGTPIFCCLISMFLETKIREGWGTMIIWYAISFIYGRGGEWPLLLLSITSNWLWGSFTPSPKSHLSYPLRCPSFHRWQSFTHKVKQLS